MGDHSSWLPLIDNFSKYYQVLIFDNRGVGKSDSTGTIYSVEQMAEDTISLMNMLDIKQPIIVGHSLGGAIAQHVALKSNNQIESLILCNTFPKFNDSSCTLFKKVVSLYENRCTPSVIFSSFISEVLSAEYLADKDKINSILNFIDAAENPQTIDGYKGQLSALITFDSKSWLNKIRTPTLVIHAELDRIVSNENAEYLARHISNAKLKFIPGGHATQIEYPELLCGEILKFIHKT